MSRRRMLISRRPLAVAIVTAAGLAAAVALIGSGPDPYRVEFEVRDAAGLRVNSDVKVAGVRAGVVKAMRVTPDDHAVVTVEIQSEAAPIGTGAKARIRPVNLLGEKYVELDPGDISSPQPSNARIPRSRTGSPVELDDVLNALDPDVRARLRILLNEGGVALLGRGSDVDKLLATLPTTTEGLAETVQDVTSQSQALREMISAAQRVTHSVGRKSDDLTRLVETADRALAPLARRRTELGATVREAPGALRTLRLTLDALDDTAAKLIGTSGQVRAAAPPLARALKTLPGFADAADATLAQARRTAPALSQLAAEATPALRRLRPTTEGLRTVARQAAPVTTTLATGAADDLLRLMENWARTITGRDGLGHVFRTHVAVDSDQLFGHALERLTPTPRTVTRRKRRTPARSSDPVRRTPARPSPAPRPVAPLPVGPLVGGTLDTLTDGVGRLLDGVGRSGSSGTAAPAAPTGDDLASVLDAFLAP